MADVTPADEYREKWHYVRHAEQIRYRSVQWYVGIVGVLLGFAYGRPLGPLHPQMRSFVLTFLVGCSLLLSASLVGRKAVYQIYADRVEKLESEKKGATALDPWTGPFAWYFYGFALLGMILSFLWGWEVFAGGEWSPLRSIGGWASAGGFGLLAGGYFVYQMRELMDYLRSRFPEKYPGKPG